LELAYFFLIAQAHGKMRDCVIGDGMVAFDPVFLGYLVALFVLAVIDRLL
jgi:hypothetical protein